MKHLKFQNIVFIVTLVSLCSCSEKSYFLPRPKETNLKYWVTEKLSDDAFSDCTYLPGWVGASEYLDGRYKPVINPDNESMPRAPEIHVTYLVTAYPDLSSSYSCVTSISITDPEIYVYGLTFNSSKDEIEKKMKSMLFTQNSNGAWCQNNCNISFNETSISIGASVTNRNQIIF